MGRSLVIPVGGGGEGDRRISTTFSPLQRVPFLFVKHLPLIFDGIFYFKTYTKGGHYYRIV